jgi:hypothetical protein
VATVQLHLPIFLTQGGLRKCQLLSNRLILTLLKKLFVAARMFVIYMMLCVHMEQEGCLDLQKLESAFAHSHVYFLHYFFKHADHHVIMICVLLLFYVCIEVIVFFWSFYATLDHLPLSVKPGGKLMTPVAEVGLYAIDDTSRKSIKHVLPLRTSVSSYFSFFIISPLLICTEAIFLNTK